MKYLLLISISFLFASCQPDVKYKGDNSFDMVKHPRADHFTYRDHKYIRFGYECGIVHDPDCPCLYDEVPFRGEPNIE